MSLGINIVKQTMYTANAWADRDFRTLHASAAASAVAVSGSAIASKFEFGRRRTEKEFGARHK